MSSKPCACSSMQAPMPPKPAPMITTRGLSMAGNLLPRRRGSAEGRPLLAVAGIAEELQVSRRARPADRDRDHMVELEQRPRTALDAATAVALEHRQPHLARDPGRRRRCPRARPAPRPLELPPLAVQPLVGERLDVGRARSSRSHQIRPR